ncbi:MAG: glycosyltransferase family 2 protein [Bacteroidota bacterium]
MNPLVSIITVNYRSVEDTLAFLESIPHACYNNLEVILIDNAAPSNHSTIYKEQFSKLIYIYSKENLGFAGANNLGIAKAKGKYLYFLNNDTILNKDSISPLVERLEKNEKLGAASPRIVFYENPELLQYAGMTPMNLFTGRNRMIGNKKMDSPVFQKNSIVGYAHGAAMIVPTKVVKQIGPMQTDYFLYYEELDWCEKIRKLGKKIELVGKGKVVHKASASVKLNSPLQIFYMTRNRLLFMFRFTGKVQFWIFWMFYRLFVIPKECLRFLVKGDKDGLRVYKQAINSAKQHFFNQQLPLQNYQPTH